MARPLAFALFFAVSLAASAAETGTTTAVRGVLAAQQDAWNRGDIVGFMKGYWQSEEIRFAGGDGFTYGWQATLTNYRRRYPDAATMGKLDFDVVEVREIAPDTAYVFGKWHLTRANEPAEKAPHGLFTLIFERKDGAWVITRDHSSAAGG